MLPVEGTTPDCTCLQLYKMATKKDSSPPSSNRYVRKYVLDSLVSIQFFHQIELLRIMVKQSHKNALKSREHLTTADPN